MNNLCFCSTTYGGYGIVRVGSQVPESHLLFISPPSCGRHTAINAFQQGYKERISYLFFDEEELALGVIEEELGESIGELLSELENRPKVILVYLCCVLYLAGFDEERAEQELSRRYPDVTFLICLMNPVAADTGRPPALTMQQRMYSLLDYESPTENSLNFLGNNVPVDIRGEIYQILKTCGVDTVHHISQKRTFAEFRQMGRARWNLVIRPEAILAAESLPLRNFRFLPVSYDITEIREQYEEIFTMLASRCSLDRYEERAYDAIRRARSIVKDRRIAIGSSAVCRPFSLAKALRGYGFTVTDIFGTDLPPFEQDSFTWIREHAPDIRIHDTRDTSARCEIGACGDAEIAIGCDAAYFSGACRVVDLIGDDRMFGYYGVEHLMDLLGESISRPRDLQTLIESYGLVA